MLDDWKISEITQKLLAKSIANEVEWRDKRTWKNSQLDGKIYSVCFPNSEVSIAFASPLTDPDFYNFTFYSKNAVITERIVTDPRDPLWDNLKALYDEADRKIRGWDIALKEIEEALDSKNKIGLPNQEAIKEEDIPF